MSNLAKFMRSKGEVAERKQESQGRGCCSVGCPNVGTISDSTHGGPFRCWAHDRMSDGAYWGLLTKGIEENRWLFKTADKVMVMPWYDLEELKKEQQINDYLSGQNRPDLARRMIDGKKEPVVQWVMRLRNAAFEAASSEAKARGWSGM